MTNDSHQTNSSSLKTEMKKTTLTDKSIDMKTNKQKSSNESKTNAASSISKTASDQQKSKSDKNMNSSSSKKNEPATTNVNKSTQKTKDSGTGKPANASAPTSQKTKKPLAMIQKMKEQMNKMKLAEEQFEQEEARKQKEFEEAESKRLEAIRVKKEARLAKKNKEKEKIQELKRQGKYLTKEQQASRLKILQLAESMSLKDKLQESEIVPGEKKVAKHKKKVKDEGSADISTQETPQVVHSNVLPTSEESSTGGIVEDWEQLFHLESSSNTSNSVSSVPKSTNHSANSQPTVTSSDTSGSSQNSNVLFEPLNKPLRSPVICVMGHVDTGKTKILDKLRNSHVQDGEAGGITQQIGATYAPLVSLSQRFTAFGQLCDLDTIDFPGLLIIDTPGHESFRNLRQRGSSLCDIAILVVDVISGIEKQTEESISLLKKRKTPFVVALNKIDRLYAWKSDPKKNFTKLIESQPNKTQMEFEDRLKTTVTSFAKQGLSVELFSRLTGLAENDIPIVPLSAHTGDGMGDLLNVLSRLGNFKMRDSLKLNQDVFKANVMEVKQMAGLGTTLDVILVSGSITEGDTIVVAGLEGVIVSQVRSIMVPRSLKETRVKSQLEHYHQVSTSRGIKITGKDLETAVAGFPLMIVRTEEEITACKEELSQIVASTLKDIRVCEKGVSVHASTLGSLEALLDFLRSVKIPFSAVNIGPIHKKDVSLAVAIKERDPIYGVILAFDVKVDSEAAQYANREGITIFTADIIYHLFDKFTKYIEDYRMAKKRENAHLAVFPGILEILPQFIFNNKNPIIVGVKVLSGSIRIGTPLCIPEKKIDSIGLITSIEVNHKSVEKAVSGQEVCIKIDPEPGTQVKVYDRHFSHSDKLISRISRESIDVLKSYFRDEVQNSDWNLIVQLKKQLNIT